MNILTWFTLTVVSVVAIVAVSQVPLVQALVTASGYSSAEVWSSVGALVFIFYTMLAVFTVR